MKKRIYVLQGMYVERSLGADYYSYHIVFPDGNHAYTYVMSQDGWHYNLKRVLLQSHEVIELDESINPKASIFGLIQLYKEAEAFEKNAEIAQEERFEHKMEDANRADFLSA